VNAEGRVRDAAVSLFAAKGFHGTGIRELADAAGLSSASLYHYMGTKENLLVEIMQVSLGRLVRAGHRVLAESAAPVAALNGLVQMHVVAHALQQAETIVVDNELRSLSSAHRSAVVALRDEYEGMWRSVIEGGCAAGSFVVPDPGVARLALLEMCTGVAYWYSPLGDRRLAEIASAHAEMGLAMLRATAGPGCLPAGHYVRLVAEVWGPAVAPRVGA
jgi:AcrR family transcriptional regulator